MKEETNKILNEILEERERQDKEWGIQNYPSIIPTIKSSSEASDYYGVPHEYVAKSNCDEACRANSLTWADILVEELAESINSPDDSHRRKELIQLAACCVANIESIDRNLLNNRKYDI